MFKSVAAVKCRCAFVFGLGFKAVTSRGDVFLDEFKKFRAESASSVFVFDVYFLDPDHAPARLLRVSVGKNAVADGLSAVFKDKSIAVWRTIEEKLEGIQNIFFGNVFKHRGRGIKILRHFGVDVFVGLCDFSDCHSFLS